MRKMDSWPREPVCWDGLADASRGPPQISGQWSGKQPPPRAAWTFSKAHVPLLWVKSLQMQKRDGVMPLERPCQPSRRSQG